MDRFANCQNAQLPRFNSRYWEPLFDGVDALAQANWHTENYSVNPPFCLLPRVLETIQEQKAHATVIAPKMARTAMVQQTSKPFSRSTAQTSEQPKGVSGNGGDSGTVSKPKMDPVCLEGLWRQMLTDPAWSIESAKRFQYCIAPSTLRSYNSGIQILQTFCVLRISYEPKVSGPPTGPCFWPCDHHIRHWKRRPLVVFSTSLSVWQVLQGVAYQPNHLDPQGIQPR